MYAGDGSCFMLTGGAQLYPGFWPFVCTTSRHWLPGTEMEASMEICQRLPLMAPQPISPRGECRPGGYAVTIGLVGTSGAWRADRCPRPGGGPPMPTPAPRPGA